MLIAAVDPAAEARLDGLNRAVTSGRYLAEQAGPAVTPGTGGIAYTTFPVLAAARQRHRRVRGEPGPGAGRALGAAGWARRRCARTPRCPATRCRHSDHRRARVPVPARPSWRRTSSGSQPGPGRCPVGVLVRRPDPLPAPGPRGLVPAAVRNPVSAWGSRAAGSFAPPDNAGTQYRTLPRQAITAPHTLSPVPVPVGTFDQGKIAAFDPLSRVPLGPYQPTVAAPASAASTQRRWTARTSSPASTSADTSASRSSSSPRSMPCPRWRTATSSLATLHRQRPDQRDPGPGGRRHRAEPGLPRPDQDSRRADRGAHPADRRYRHRLIPRSHDCRAGGRAGTGSPPCCSPRAGSRRASRSRS